MQINELSDVQRLQAVREALQRMQVAAEEQINEPPPLPPPRNPETVPTEEKRRFFCPKIPNASPTLKRATAAVTTLFSRPTSKRSSVGEPTDSFHCQYLPDGPITPGIIEALAYDEHLVGAIETLSNSCKNFKFISLFVPDDMPPFEFSTALLDELTKWQIAFDKNLPLPQIQGNDVADVDRLPLKNFIGQIYVDETWTELFHEMIRRKDDATRTRAFISPRVCQSLALLNSQNDALKIATHLMSECSDRLGTARIIHKRMLQLLMVDNRIKAFPGLRTAIKDAANYVMLEAIRKCQSDIVFFAVQRKSERTAVADAWKLASERHGDKYHDLEGINLIAKAAGLKLMIIENPECENQKILRKLIKRKNKLAEILSMYREKHPSSTEVVKK